MHTWQELYRIAVLEADNKKLEAGLAETETLMFLRLLELPDHPTAAGELQEILTAWQTMSMLRFERLGWPDFRKNAASRHLKANAAAAARPR